MKRLFIIISILVLFTGCWRIRNELDDNNQLEVDILVITINNKKYIINIEDNSTVSELVKILPLELEMNELNGNEKYVYLDKSLPTDSYYPKHIEAGDVMLFGNNCLVIFYKSFDTTYSYTKIGHIDNIGDLGNSSIKVLIEDN